MVYGIGQVIHSLGDQVRQLMVREKGVDQMTHGPPLPLLTGLHTQVKTIQSLLYTLYVVGKNETENSGYICVNTK